MQAVFRGDSLIYYIPPKVWYKHESTNTLPIQNFTMCAI